jgi:hypothetical protein
MLIRYLAGLSRSRTILWCYLIWYLMVLVRYFDPNPRLWLTSLGLCAIIGAALYLNAVSGQASKTKPERWQIIRLFMMPLCVSSFAALVKGKGFVLIFSPDPREDLAALGLCAAFWGAAFWARRATALRAPR